MQGHLLAERSLQQRYALQTACAVCLATLLGVTGLLLADDIADEAIYDQQLCQLAAVIAGHADDEAVPPDEATGGASLVRAGRPLPPSVMYQVWLRDGTLVQRSPQSPYNIPLVRSGQQGFSSVVLQGHSYRTYAEPSADGRSVVQVAQRINSRDRLSLIVLSAGLVSLLVPLFMTWRASGLLLRRSLRMLDTLAAGVQQRDPHDARPVELDAPPREIRPLLDSVNGLVQRSANVISLEQGFTSVAAHELRAPLAGIRAQAQLASQAGSTDELQQALKAVMTGVDRAAHAFDQLLDLTRMEGLGSAGAAVFEEVDLLEPYRQVLEELQAQLRQRQIRMSLQLAPQAVHGVPFAVYLILRNLMANAILYTPQGGQVAVSSLVTEEGLLLRVDDSGPGIAQADRARVFARYTRLHRTRCEGIGLGLSIVQQAVQLHRAAIRLLDAPQGGLRAEVCFPLAA